MLVFERVQAYIDKNGFQQIVIANKAEMPAATLQALLSGKQTMYADDLRAICYALNVRPEAFLEPQSV